MKNIAIKISILIVFVFVFTSIAFATGPATVYKVKITKFELYNGTSWVTVFEGTTSALDIASVSSGSSVGNFFSGLAVPDGVYTQARVTPAPSFTISGNDGVSYTTATVGPGSGSVPGAAAAQAECTITLTGVNVPTAQIQDFSATPITVTNGSPNHKVRVSFNVSNAVQLLGGELYPASPAVTMSIQ